MHHPKGMIKPASYPRSTASGSAVFRSQRGYQRPALNGVSLERHYPIAARGSTHPGQRVIAEVWRRHIKLSRCHDSPHPGPSRASATNGSPGATQTHRHRARTPRVQTLRPPIKPKAGVKSSYRPVPREPLRACSSQCDKVDGNGLAAISPAVRAREVRCPRARHTRGACRAGLRRPSLLVHACSGHAGAVAHRSSCCCLDRRRERAVVACPCEGRQQTSSS